MRPSERRVWLGPIGWVRGIEWNRGDRAALLRRHQARAVASALAAMEGRGHRLMKHRRGIMLADDVGMGKTREAIAAVALYMSRHRIRQPLSWFLLLSSTNGARRSGVFALREDSSPERNEYKTPLIV